MPSVRAAGAVLLMALATLGCVDEYRASELPPVSSPDVPGSWLRVTNAGSLPIRQLAIAFPRQLAVHTDDEIAFGDIAAGKTTEYRQVPAVFPYAVFRYAWDGRLVTQPVRDWVGVMPLDRGRYTYRLSLQPGAGLRIEDVVKDAWSGSQAR